MLPLPSRRPGPAVAQALRVALDTLRANPLRTLLSTLGIVMGAASLAGVLSLGDGVEAFARQQLEREGVNVISVTSRASETVDGLRVPRSEYPVFTIADTRDLAGHVPPGTTVRLSVEGTGLARVQPGDRPRAALVNGLFAGAGDAGLRLEAGRAFTSEEAERGDPVVIVSHALALVLVPGSPAAAVGRTLQLQESPRRVVGVTAAYPGERLLAAWVPLTNSDNAMVPSATPRPRVIHLASPRVEDVPALRDTTTRWAAGRNPRWADQVQVAATGRQRLESINQGILIFKVLMGAFTAISLVVGGIGIMNVLLASVMERTREIGVRRSVGARRRDLVLQFLAESVAISVVGAVIGAALGIAAAHLATAIMRAKTEALVFAAVTWQTVAVSVGAALVVGIVFGVYPALRAAGLSPVEAVHFE
jgi:putative ABC transport system permease protein